MKKQKICFSGPSGIGKTTLCKHLDKTRPEDWESTSAWDILTDQDKKRLLIEYGYEPKGHQNVINMSATNPDFGHTFQGMVLIARHKQIQDAQQGIILDRSPLDNIVYMLTQVSHNLSEKNTADFITLAQRAWAKLDIVYIVLHSNDVPGVEDNNSRVANRYFQKYISDIFRGTYYRYLADVVGPVVEFIDVWDLSARKAIVDRVLTLEDSKIDFHE